MTRVILWVVKFNWSALNKKSGITRQDEDLQHIPTDFEKKNQTFSVKHWDWTFPAVYFQFQTCYQARKFLTSHRIPAFYLHAKTLMGYSAKSPMNVW